MAKDKMVQEMIETAFRNLNETEKKQLMEKLGYVHEVTAWELGTMLKHLRGHYGMMAFGIPPEDIDRSSSVTWGIDDETVKYFLQCVETAFSEGEYGWAEFKDCLSERDMLQSSRSQEDLRNEEIVELMFKYPSEQQAAFNCMKKAEALLEDAFQTLRPGTMRYDRATNPTSYAYCLFLDLYRERVFSKVTKFYNTHIQGR